MIIDLHVHSRDCSDGRLTLDEIFQIAHERKVGFFSITDHDSVDCQDRAMILARDYGIHYVTGVELNIRFSTLRHNEGKAISLDLLGYGYDPKNNALTAKTKELRDHREKRARLILERVNNELTAEGLAPLGENDIKAIEQSVDGAFGRPHIARYLVKLGLVKNVQEAFDKYLVRCDVPKLPLSLQEASELIRGAGGRAVLAHGNDPNGTSLASLTDDISEQLHIIESDMLPYLDGLECWHTRHDLSTTQAYESFAHAHGLIATGGSDCHQNPIRIGTVAVPAYVVEQLEFT